MSKKTFSIVLLLVIVADLIASYFCYLQTPVLGDLSNIVLPSEDCRHILSDPLGFRVLLTGEQYVSTNRFFIHWIPYHYFNNFPFFLQWFTNPVDSIYICCALIKLIAHVGITTILSYWIVGKVSRDSSFLCIFGLISALFLASPYGYFFPMRVVDQSIVYTFAYAFSFMFVLLYLHPFVCMYQGFRGFGLKWWEHIVLIVLSFLVVFHGPINAPSIILIAGLALFFLWLAQWKVLAYNFKYVLTAVFRIERNVLVYFIWIILLGSYSFYLGRFNAENPAEIPSLMERYVFLWKGVFKSFFIVKTTPLPIIGLTVIFYILMPKKFKSEKAQKAFDSIKYIVLFAVIYTLLLPLGGHRGYRSLIFRFDTMLPITCGVFFIFGSAAYLLIQHLKDKRKMQFQLFLLTLILASSIIDSVSLYPVRNECERSTLFQLSEATEEPVLIRDCSILSWGPVQPTGEPSSQSKLLHRWNITKKPLIYYHKEE